MALDGAREDCKVEHVALGGDQDGELVVEFLVQESGFRVWELGLGV